MAEKNIKWSQWSEAFGMMRCGYTDYKTAMRWMTNLGKEAKEALKKSDKAHAVYGRKMYNEDDELIEIRYYCGTYMDDDELDKTSRKIGHDLLYVAHK